MRINMWDHQPTFEGISPRKIKMIVCRTAVVHVSKKKVEMCCEYALFFTSRNKQVQTLKSSKQIFFKSLRIKNCSFRKVIAINRNFMPSRKVTEF